MPTGEEIVYFSCGWDSLSSMKTIAGTQGRNPEVGLEFTKPTLCNIGVQTQRLVPAREVLFWMCCIPSLGLKTHHPTYKAVLKMKQGNIYFLCFHGPMLFSQVRMACMSKTNPGPVRWLSWVKEPSLMIWICFLGPT